MSNNPGKKGKQAPWVRRAQEERVKALEDYRFAHHPAYAEWSTRRKAAFSSFMADTNNTSPADVGWLKAIVWRAF